jgi:hypothetical protein
MKDFEFTFVDLKLPNSQPRQNRVFRGKTQGAARAAFATTLGTGFNILNVREVVAITSLASLAALNTRAAGRNPSCAPSLRSLQNRGGQFPAPHHGSGNCNCASAGGNEMLPTEATSPLPELMSQVILYGRFCVTHEAII